jgi:hypothetical protein
MSSVLKINSRLFAINRKFGDQGFVKYKDER